MTSPKKQNKKNNEDQGMLCKCVRKSLNKYFKDLNGEDVSNVYQMVLKEIEKPLLEVVMEKSNHNQSKASKILGINRNTLRKKLDDYDILD